MAFKIGAKIALDGEKEYRDALKQMDASMRVLKSEMKLLSTEFAGQTRSVEAATAKQRNLSAQVEQQKEKVRQLEAALDKANAEYGEGSAQANRWAAQLNDAKAALVKTERELDKTNDELKELKRQDGAVAQLREKFEQLKDRVQDIKDKTERLRDVMGKLGGAAKAGIAAGAAAVAAVGTAAVNAGKQVYSMAQDVAAAGDAVDKGSQKLRLSTDDYQRLAYAADISGTSIDTLATANKTLQASGKNLDLRQAIDQVAAIEDADARAAAATELFGKKAGQELLPLLNAGADGLAAMYGEAEAYGMIMSEDAVKASAAFQDSLNKMQGTLNGLKNQLIGELLPGMTGIQNGLTEILNGDPEAGIRMIGEAVGQLTDKIAELLPDVMRLGGEVLTALVESIGANAPELLLAAVDIVMALGDGLLANLDELIDAAFLMLDAIIAGLGSHSEQLTGAALRLIQTLSTGLLQRLPEIMNAGIQLLLGLISGLSEPGVIGEILKAGLSAAGQLFKGLIQTVPQMLDAGWQLIKGLWAGIGDAANWLWEQIKGLGRKLVSTVKGIFGIHSPSSVFRDEIGKNLMLGWADGVKNNAELVRRELLTASESMPTVVDYEYRLNGIRGQIDAANAPIAVTASQTAPGSPPPSGGGGPAGLPIETVIELLRIIAANSRKQIVLSDGTLFGWLNDALGRGADDDERGVTV